MSRALRVLLVLTLGAGLAVPVAASAEPTATAAPEVPQVDRQLGFGDRPPVISCTSNRYCMVVGTNGRARVFRGAERGRLVVFPALPTDRYSKFADVSCVTPTFCAAVTTTSATIWDGLSWSTPVTLPPLRAVFGGAPALSCSSTTFCVVVGGHGAWRLWNGSAWTTLHGGPNAGADTDENYLVGLDVSCASAAFCVAADSSRFGANDSFTGELSRWDGSRWRPSYQPGSESDTHALVSCPTTTFCRAFVTGLLRTWNGAGWSDVQVDGQRDLDMLRCFADHRCIGEGSLSATTRYTEHLRGIDGASWTDLATIPNATPYVAPVVDCSAAVTCRIAVGNNVSRQWVDNGGFGFGDKQQLGDRLYDALDVSCADEEFCAAVNARSELGLLSSGNWQRPIPLRSISRARALSCAPDACVVVTEQGDALHVGRPGDYGNAAHIDSQPLTAVSCSSGEFCVALDALGRVIRYEDGTWHTPTQHSPDGVLRSVSCVSATFCMVTGHGYVVIYYGNGIWTWPTKIGDYAGPVDCSSAHYCVVGALNAVRIWRGSGFTEPVTLRGVRAVDRISCPEEEQCVIDTPHGHVFLDGAHQGVAGFPPLPDGSSSCWSATGCLIVGDADHAYTTTGAPRSGR